MRTGRDEKRDGVRMERKGRQMEKKGGRMAENDIVVRNLVNPSRARRVRDFTSGILEFGKNCRIPKSHL